MKNSQVGPEKRRFKFKTKENGNFLTVHNTVAENGCILRIRIILAAFNDNNTCLTVIDHRGEIFIFDLISKKYWTAYDKILKCSAICSIPSIFYNDLLSRCLITTKSGNVFILNIDSGIIEKSNNISSHQIHISISSIKTSKNVLVYSINEAILVNVITLIPIYTLNSTINRFSLKYVSFIPECDKILACFTNDAVHIWSGNNFNIIRILYPMKIRNRYLKHHSNIEIPELYKTDILINDITIKDITKGIINSIAFSSDGHYCCITFNDNYLMILSVGDYEIIKLIKLKYITCKEILFHLIHSEIYLFILTTTSDVILIDCTNLKMKILMQDNKSYKFGISKDGQIFFIILKTGETNLYKTFVIINLLRSVKECSKIVKNDERQSKKIGHKKSCKPTVDDYKILNCQLKNQITHDRMRLILQEYGEYPAKYRHLIWSTLLDLPNNKIEFMKLIKKDLHPIVKNYDKLYPLKDHLALRNLKKISSCIIHWCKVFKYCDYLPTLIFPFLKIFPNNLILTFELIFSILLNQCQLWFEFIPAKPFNYIGIIENLFNHYDPELMKFYTINSIKIKHYALPLMETAFSEVLDNEQWIKLWDHIITNPSYFLIFCIISYNITQRKQIMEICNKNTIIIYFHEQNIINMKKFLNNIYKMMKKCPKLIHPQRYINDFIKLPKEFYPKFENYPKELIIKSENEIDMIRNKREILDKKIHELQCSEMEIIKNLEDGLKNEEHEKQIREISKIYENSIKQEKEKTDFKKALLSYHLKSLRQRQARVIQLLKEKKLGKQMNQNEIDELQKKIHDTDIRNELDMMLAYDNMKSHELNLLEREYSLAYKDVPHLKDYSKDDIKNLEDKYKNLNYELKQLNLSQGKQRKSEDPDDFYNDIAKEIDKIEEILEHTVGK